MGKPLSGVGEQYCYTIGMWHDRSTDNVVKGVGRGVWQVHLYGEAARCSLRDLFELLGKGSRQVHLNGGATNCVDVVGVGWELHL